MTTEKKSDLDRIFILRPCYENAENDIREMRSLDMEITELTEEEIEIIRKLVFFSKEDAIRKGYYIKYIGRCENILKKLERIFLI